jgi:TolA-binding protein
MDTNAKVEKLEKRISKMEHRIQVLEKRFEDLQNSLISGVFKYLKKKSIEEGRTVKQATSRLEDWVKKKYGEDYSQLSPNKKKHVENEWRRIFNVPRFVSFFDWLKKKYDINQEDFSKLDNEEKKKMWEEHFKLCSHRDPEVIERNTPYDTR